MAFPRRLLIEGEELVLDLRPHPIALFFPALLTLIGLVAAVWISQIDAVAWWIPWGAFLVFLLVFPIPRFLNWWTSTFAVTSDRVVHRYGWISKFSMEIPLEAINDVREAATQAGNGHPRVAFCGERAGRLWAAGRTAEAVQLEQLCGELAHDVDILCAYPVPYTEDDQALTRVCGGHTAVAASCAIRNVGFV